MAEASGRKLLDAAVHVIRSKGYSAARGRGHLLPRPVSPRARFFHHFASKEACAIAAAAHFAANADALFDAAPHSHLPDARARILGYVDFRKAILQGELPQFTCLLGTMVQEASIRTPRFGPPATVTSATHAERLEADMAEAKARYAPTLHGRRQRRALFTGCPARRVHSRQSEARPESRR